MGKPKFITALEHALVRLNNIEHNYDDTDFKFIESALVEAYEKHDIPKEKRLNYLKERTAE